MFASDIDKKFTEKVQEYLSEGYIFNSHTMGGSQGEIAKVDLRKGDEIVRIYIENVYRYMDESTDLVVGRCFDVNDRFAHSIIWNDSIKEVERIRFYVIGDTKKGCVYGTKEEYQAALQKREQRRRSGKKKYFYNVDMTQSLKKYAYKVLKKRNGLKSIKLSEINAVRCFIDEDGFKVVNVFYRRDGSERFTTVYTATNKGI